MKILAIGTDWNNNEYRRINNAPGAISTYRLIYPQRYSKYDIDYVGSDYLKKIENKIEVLGLKEFFSQYDLVISKITDNAYAASSIRFITKHLGIPLVVDIDDNIWELKPDQPGYKIYNKGGANLGVASTYLSLADAVFVSTQPLGDYIKKRLKDVYKDVKPVIVLPNCVDTDDYNFPKAKLDKDKIIIGWQGSITHHEDLKLALPAIGKLMMEYPNLYLELLGGVPKETVGDLFKDVDDSVLDKITSKGGVPAFDTFPKLLSEQAWDIAIAPITDESFNHAKSHIKWMEYAMFSIPCVASNVYPYREDVQGVKTIIDGETGVLAKPDEWYTKLKHLIEYPSDRVKIGNNAKYYVENYWHIKKHVHKWDEAIEMLLSMRK